MVCHEFKGGIGTASRVIDAACGGWTVGVLVQANYGRRDWLRVDGVPVGEAIPSTEVPSPYGRGRRRAAGTRRRAGSGSIIVVVATDAPLLPHQCERLAQRAGLGIARMGGTGAHSSGDLFICFATGNRGLPRTRRSRATRASPSTSGRSTTTSSAALFDGVIEATEEAILNALVAAETMTGRDGITAHALPHDRLRRGHGPLRRGRGERPAGDARRERAVRPIRGDASTTSSTIRSILADTATTARSRWPTSSGRTSATCIARRGARRRSRATGVVGLRRDDRHRAVRVHLADLFVGPTPRPGHRPAAARRGVRRRPWPRTTFASDDPRALPLYVRAGMPPLWPSLYVERPRDASEPDRSAAASVRADRDVADAG